MIDIVLKGILLTFMGAAVLAFVGATLFAWFYFLGEGWGVGLLLGIPICLFVGAIAHEMMEPGKSD